MSEADIDKAVKEAAEFEAQDKKRKDAIDTRNDADSFVFQTQQALDQVGANLDANDKAEVETLKSEKEVKTQELNATKQEKEKYIPYLETLKNMKESLLSSAQYQLIKEENIRNLMLNILQKNEKEAIKNYIDLKVQNDFKANALKKIMNFVIFYVH